MSRIEMDCAEVFFSGHAVHRMFERGLGRDATRSVIADGEIIAEYRDDKPYPSCLILGFVCDAPVHVVVARQPANPPTRQPGLSCSDGLQPGSSNVVHRFQNAEVEMKCVICKTGDVVDGRTTVTLQRGASTVIIKNVPARVCDQCGEYYLSEDMTGKILAMAEEAVDKGAEVEILRWAA